MITKIQWVAILVLVVIVGWLYIDGGDSPTPYVPADTVSGGMLDDLQQERDDLQRRAQRQGSLIENLRATIEGLEARRPERVTVFDTVIRYDTVPVFLTVGMEGDEATALRVEPADSAGMGQPREETFDVSGCDEWQVMPDGTLVCDRPTFGHLSLVLFSALSVTSPESGGLVADVNLRWRKHNDSPWRIGARWTTTRPRSVDFGIWRKVDIW